MPSRVILIGVGGATSSGKTTLAKHLGHILPNSVIVHQDDFAPPQSQIPVHPIHQVQDWDAAPGAIDWQRFLNFLRHVKATGVSPTDHISHDHLNEQKDIPIGNECRKKWVSQFGSSGDEITWVIVDGFLLYWHPLPKEVVQELDVRFFLRVPHDVLKQRRDERHGYHMAVQSNSEGNLWRDPPQYWENIVYPAYVEAHKDMFENGDVEQGMPRKKMEDIVLLDVLGMSMDEVVDRCCTVIKGKYEGWAANPEPGQVT